MNKSIASVASVVVVSFLCSMSVHAQDHGGQLQDAPIQIMIPRGESPAAVHFFVNSSWKSKRLAGVLSRMEPGESDFEVAGSLGSANISAKRFTSIGLDIPTFLRKVSQGNWKDQVGEPANTYKAQTKADGSFDFGDVRPGFYVLEIDWSSVPDSVKFAEWQLVYPERYPSLSSLVLFPDYQ